MRRLLFRSNRLLFLATFVFVLVCSSVIYLDDAHMLVLRRAPSLLKTVVYELSDLSQWLNEGADRETIFHLNDARSASGERNHLCNMPSFAHDAAIAMEHLAADFSLLASRFDSCSSGTRDQLSVERLVRVHRSPVDGTSVLRMNASFFATTSRSSSSSSTCTAQRFDKRMNESEENENVDMLDSPPLVFSASDDYQIRAHRDGGYYYIRCVDADRGMKTIVEHVVTVLPADFGSLLTTKTNKAKAKTKTKTKTKTKAQEKMSVLMIGIDSVSRHHFRRIFPRTYEFLSARAHASRTALFEQFSSLGLNTYPNIIALLTGLVAEPIDEYQLHGELSAYRDHDSTFHDRLPFVWNDYAASGYVTIMQEDRPAIGVFNYKKKGFRYKPTHIYGRAYWTQYYAIRSGPDMCHQLTPTYDTWIEQTELSVQALNGTGVPYFALNYMTEYTHEYESNAHSSFFAVDSKRENNNNNNKIVCLLSRA